MSFRLVGVELLDRWYDIETDAERHAVMNEWLADLLDEPGPDRTKQYPVRTHYSASRSSREPIGRSAS